MTTDIKQTLSLLREGQMRFVHSPDLWSMCKLPVNLNWKSIKFTGTNRRSVPSNQRGVYAFMLEPVITGPPKSAYLLYIGKTQAKGGFRSRYGHYLSERERFVRPKIGWMLERWNGHIWFHYAPIDDVNLIKQTENSLLEACVPPFNSQYPGVVGKAMKVFLGV